MLPLQTRCRPSIDSLSAVVGNQSSQKADVFFFSKGDRAGAKEFVFE
jgi:hypothetical protein